MSHELWACPVDFPLYEVSSWGRIASHHGRKKELSSCVRKDGYPVVTLRGGGRVRQVMIHRLVLELFVGPCPEGMEARHLDDNRLNSRVENLAWGTRSENIRDRFANGKGNAGENHPLASLTEKLVHEIRRLSAAGLSLREIGLRVGFGSQTVHKVLLGKRWAHVPIEPGVDPTTRPQPMRLLSAFGETKRLTAWTRDDRCSVSVPTLIRRLAAGWDTERAIATPSQASCVKL